jgi:hypothetical protein
MKIRTIISNEFGQSITFGNDLIKFDRLGVAEVDDKLGKKLLDIHVGHLVDGDTEDISKGKPNIYEKELVDSTITKLQEDNEKLKGIIKDRESTIKVIDEDNKTWKLEVDKLKDISEKAVEELEGFKTQKQKEVDELNFRIKLLPKTNKELVDVCLQLELVEEKFKGLTKKEDLIELIIAESRK